MRRDLTFVVALIVLSLSAPAWSTAERDDDSNGSALEDGFFVKSRNTAQSKRSEGTRKGSGPANPASYPTAGLKPGPCIGAGLIEINQGPQGAEVTYCPADDKPATATVTVGMVRSAFAALKLPGSTLSLQPPDGVTLVNFETNFYTDDTGAITKRVTLLGQRVAIEATPSSFTFHFGDDLKLDTTDPGAPYPKLRVTHNYLRKDTYRPWLSTTYSGRFKVGNGPWQDIPGTVTIDGPKQRLRAIEASPKLVGY